MKPFPQVFEGWALGAIAATQKPGKPLLVGPRPLTYGELAERMAQLGSWFAAQGLVRGHRVALAVTADDDVVVWVLALLRWGLVPMVMSPESTPAEALDLLGWVEPEALIVDRKLAESWGVASRLPAGTPVLHVARGAAGSVFSKLFRQRDAGCDDAYPQAIAGLPPSLPPAPPSPDDLAYVLFTSGSTARPKGVEISHGALEAHLTTLTRRFDYSPNTRLLNVLPLYHADGLFHGPIAAFRAGGTVIRPFTFAIDRLEAFEDTIYAERVTHVVAVPTMLALLLRFASGPAERFPELTTITSTAAALTPQVWEGAATRYGVPIANVYGLTETVCGSLFSGPDSDSLCIGTVGRPDDCEVRVVKPDGTLAESGEVGEIQLRGPHLMRGYHRAPAETAAAFDGGWLKTGDLATCDANGLYRIVGRAKQVIVTGGHNVAPDEVTAVLEAHAAVREAATVGVAEPTWGEVVVACVVCDGGTASVADILAHCRARLSPYKVPQRIHVLDRLPRGPSGKVRIEALREQLAELEAAEPAPGLSTSDLGQAVFQIAARCFQVPLTELSSTSGPHNTLGWTSLANMELVVGLEKRFSIVLSARDIMAMSDLGAAIKAVERHVAGVAK